MLLVIFRRNLYRQLGFFTAYLIALWIWNPMTVWVATTPYFSSSAWLHIYWSVEFSLSILRLLTIAEISRRLLRGYPAIWAFASWLLSGVAAALLLWTISSAIHNVHHVRRFILLGDQRFECMQAVLLVTLLLIAAYYRIKLPGLYHSILIGIGFYSSIQVVNNVWAIRQVIIPNSIFDYTRRSAIAVSVVIWTVGILRSPAIPDSEPSLISQSTYDRLAPEVHARLKELNDKLSDLTGKRRR
jgi:hypothetical protein